MGALPHRATVVQIGGIRDGHGTKIDPQLSQSKSGRYAIVVMACDMPVSPHSFTQSRHAPSIRSPRPLKRRLFSQQQIQMQRFDHLIYD